MRSEISQKKMKTSINRLFSGMAFPRPARIFTALIAAATGAAAILVAVAFAAGGPSPSDEHEIDRAMADALAIVLSRANPPQDPQDLESAVWAVFAGLNPELALQEMRKDPDFAAAEAEAFRHFGHPEEIEAELRRDEAMTRARTEAFEAFTKGAEESTAQYYRALAAQLAELKLPPDSERWNDPEWRRQREEPIRALAPVQQATNVPAE